ncbi:MAG: transposase [Clostridiales Family XIII bacterium]|jgi:hypothetical protein|nr:transposase [Clostridiales Family XIII bacterium]
MPVKIFPVLQPGPLPGHVAFITRAGLLYATYSERTYIENGKVYHVSHYLGKVIDKKEHLFYHTEYGYFNFTTEKGYIPRPDIIFSSPHRERVSLRYGDIWVFDEIIRKFNLLSLFEKVTPKYINTLLTLVVNRLSNPCSPYDSLANWYDRSFAQILYPNATVSLSGIQKYLELLGQDNNYKDFSISYFNYMSQCNFTDNLRESPVLIDGTYLTNSIKMSLTGVSNHNIVINNEVRLIYVNDQISGLPLYFNLIPGNIVDNSTLKQTVNTLKAYGIDLKFIIIDTEYSFENNFDFLNELKISFITRMNSNSQGYNDIILNHSHDIDDSKYIVRYESRFLHCKKIPYTIDNQNYYAYLIKDINRISHDLNDCYTKYFDKPNGLDIIQQNNKYLSKFILISNSEIDENDILKIYESRSQLDQLLGIFKDNSNIILPYMRTVEAFKGHLIISFLAIVISLLINNKLKDFKYNSIDIFSTMRELDIDIYETINMVKVPTNDEKEIISILNLETPFEIETGILKSNYLNSLCKKRKVSLLKGKRNKLKELGKASDFATNLSDTLEQEKQKKRGRPPKPRNYDFTVSPSDPETNKVSIQKRGRPKATKNKPKLKNH